ncbi:hypothetical protein MTP04_18890 [Lysinibacillus sp. PLM2]|nr:hypothetical protein MTP04_18890 [Lysinibacillus sp. PLM2]
MHKILTTISTADILYISTDDISTDDMSIDDISIDDISIDDVKGEIICHNNIHH